MMPTPSVTSSNDDASSMHSVASKHTLVDTPEDSALVIHLVLPSFHPEDSFSRDIALSRLFPETGNISQGSFAANWQTNIFQVVVIKQVAAALMHIGVSRKKITIDQVVAFPSSLHSYYSNRYFVQQFVDNLHPLVQKLIGTRITTGVNCFSLAMPLLMEYSPQQLLITIMEHLRNQHAMASQSFTHRYPRSIRKTSFKLFGIIT